MDEHLEQRDLLCMPPTEPSDLALMLTIYDNIEMRRRGAWRELVDGVVLIRRHAA